MFFDFIKSNIFGFICINCFKVNLVYVELLFWIVFFIFIFFNNCLLKEFEVWVLKVFFKVVDKIVLLELNVNFVFLIFIKLLCFFILVFVLFFLLIVLVIVLKEEIFLL